MLAECLIAAAGAALLLPLFVSGFASYLGAFEELRQRQEAMRVAASCVEACEAIGGAPSQEWIEENLVGCMASYEVAVSVSDFGSVRTCDAAVSWRNRRGEQKVSLSRRIR